MKILGAALVAVCLGLNSGPDASAEDDALRHARELLARVPLVDGHTEQIGEQVQGDLSRYDLRQRREKGDTDIPRLRAGLVGGQFLSVWIASGLQAPARTQLAQIDIARRVIAAYPDVFMLATRADDVERARRQGRIASFLGMENGQALENSLGALRAFYGGPMPLGLEDVSRFPSLFAELIRRGWSDPDLAKLAGGNVIRALAGAEAVAARLQKERPASAASFEALDRQR